MMRRRRAVPLAASAPYLLAPLPLSALALVLLMLLPSPTLAAATLELALGGCVTPLGMEESRIPDSAISASSSYEEKSVGPQNARINQERNGGAWCPKAQISSEVHEYLEVDLGRAHRVTQTLTQGRFGNGQGQEYAEAFLLEYWRDTLGRWALYRDSRGRKELAGNVNTYLVARQPLELPFVASRVRFIPFSEHPRTVCMRVELMGCPWDQGLLSYTAPPADEWGGGADARALQDLSYDGVSEAGKLHGGLGQLTDGRFGSADFLLLDPAAATPDSRWVGWRNDTRSSRASGGGFGRDFGGDMGSSFSNGFGDTGDVARGMSVVVGDRGGGRDAASPAALELLFEFDVPREFSVARLCVCSAPTSGVQVFAAAHALFSLDGRRFSRARLVWASSSTAPPPIVPPSSPSPPAAIVTSRAFTGAAAVPPRAVFPHAASHAHGHAAAVNVSVPLHGRMGRFIKLQLVFAARWILLSEVAFDSAPLPRNLSEELLEAMVQRQQEAAVAGNSGGGFGGGAARSGSKGEGGDGGGAPGGEAAGGESTHARKEITPATSASSNHQAYIGLITGILAMVVLLLAATVVLMVRRGRKKVALLHKHTALVSGGAKPGVAINMKELKMNMALSTPVISAGLARVRSVPRGCTVAASGTAAGAVAAPDSSVGGCGAGACEGDGVPPPDPEPAADPTNLAAAGCVYGDADPGEESEDSETSSVYHEPYKLLPSAKQDYGCLLKKDTLSSSKSGEYTDFTSVNSFQDEVKFSSSFYKLTPPPPPVARPPPYEKHTYTPTKSAAGAPPPENYYAATDIVKTERREQHLAAGKFTPLKLPEGPARDAGALLDFPRHRLRLLEKLGEGNFGLVHLCEVEGGVPEYTGVASCQRKQFLIVKSLRRGCSEATRQEFLCEAGWLASLRDPNIARVLAVCAAEEPLCVLQETAELGNLPLFLQLQSAAAAADGTPGLSYGCLIYIATQVASGMKYLESIELVHRDLAARNCAVGKHYSVKITDHAMYCTKYETDYYVSDTQSLLPVRWMAWESLLLGKYHPKSDVWAFAVTLWEILMLCAQQPFAELTNEQVVENCNHWYQNDGLQRLLARPAACPREIYDLMGECWKRHEADRPRFSEIHLFLQRKNLGYVPANG